MTDRLAIAARPLPAPANRSIPAPANQSDAPILPLGQPRQLRPAVAAPAPEDAPADIGRAEVPLPPLSPRSPANDAALQRRYDWTRSAIPAETPKAAEPSRLDKSVRLYGRIVREASRFRGVTIPRRWALGLAGGAAIAVLGGAGMTLLFDPSHDAAKPAATAQSAPAKAAPAQPAVDPKPEQLAVAAPEQQSAPEPVVPAVSTAALATPVPADAVTALMQPQTSLPPSAPAVRMLETDNARWARDHEPALVQAGEQDAAAAPQAAMQGDGPDNAITSGIRSAKPIDPSSVLADDQPAATETASPAKVAGGSGDAAGTITTAVKMRAKESNDATVVAVLPAHASVDVLSCKAWCKVSYKGQEGFVYKRFIKR